VRRGLGLALAALAALAAGGTARGDAFDRIGDGAPVYLAMRPVALVGALQRVGFDQLPSVQKLKRQMGGIDPFNPAILAAPGIDVAAPLVLSLVEPAGPNQSHSRIVATLRDVGTFTTFIDAIAASGQVKLTRVDAASPLGREGVVAQGNLANDVAVILRVVESDAIVDIVNTTDGKKAPPAAELARRFAIKPLHAFAVGKGARRLFTPDAAAVAYLDGRRMQPIVKALMEQEQRAAVSPMNKARLDAKERERDKHCAVWSHAPTTFDDIGLALGATPEGLSLTWAWGTASGVPLGGLKLHAVDDAGLDAELLGHEATAVVALYAASLASFTALKHTGPFANADALSAALDGCDTLAGMTLVVRSWPLAIAALTTVKPGDAGGPLASLQSSFGALRNVVIALRDVSPAGPRGAVAATFDPAARTMLELLLAASGAGAPTNIGKRSPTVYGLTIPGLPKQVTAALETLAAGRVGFTVADSDDSLSWAFRSDAGAAAVATRDKPPALRLAADMAELAKLGPMLNAGRDTQQVLDMLARLRRVDGELVADGDLFRLTLHSALKQ
jgi:hypothetical protein